MGMKPVSISMVTALMAAAAVSPALGQDADGQRAAVGEGTVAPKSARAPGDVVEKPGNRTGTSVLEQAAKLGKYTVIFFYRVEDERTDPALEVFHTVVAELTDRVESVVVRVDDADEKKVVDRFKVHTAPMPFVLAVAPNGAVTRSFRTLVNERQLASAFVSPGSAQSLKALQDGKLVFVCIQNSATHLAEEAMKGVNEFKNDPQYTKTTEVITIDPGDAAEFGFIRSLGVDPKAQRAVTVFLAPPGKHVGVYNGGTDKKALVASAKAAAKKKPCCPPGKKGGCKPKKTRK